MSQWHGQPHCEPPESLSRSPPPQSCRWRVAFPERPKSSSEYVNFLYHGNAYWWSRWYCSFENLFPAESIDLADSWWEGKGRKTIPGNVMSTDSVSALYKATTSFLSRIWSWNLTTCRRRRWRRLARLPTQPAALARANAAFEGANTVNGSAWNRRCTLDLAWRRRY